MAKRKATKADTGLRYTIEGNLVVAYDGTTEVGREAWCKPSYRALKDGGWVNSRLMDAAATRLRERLK